MPLLLPLLLPDIAATHVASVAAVDDDDDDDVATIDS
jgi:hypothetical protein